MVHALVTGENNRRSPAHQQQCLLLLDDVELGALLMLLLSNKNVFDALFHGEFFCAFDVFVVHGSNLVAACVTLRSWTLKQWTTLIDFDDAFEGRERGEFAWETWDILDGVGLLVDLRACWQCCRML